MFLGSVLFYVETPALYSCIRAESSVLLFLPGYRTDVSARWAEREGQTGYLNLLVVLSKSPPAWSDVNTSG